MSVNDGSFHEQPIDPQARRLIDVAFAPPDRVTWPWILVPSLLVALGLFLFRYVFAGPADLSNWAFALGVALGLMLVTVPGLILLAALAGVASDRRRIADHRAEAVPRRERLLASGTIAAASFDANRAVLFEPFEDEGFLYLFALRTGGTLLLTGKLPPLRSDAAIDWPGCRFQLLRSPDREDLLGIIGDGSQLEVTVLPRALAVEEPHENLAGRGRPLACEVALLLDQGLEDVLPNLLGRCSECGYQLRGSTSLACPECGHAFLT